MDRRKRSCCKWSTVRCVGKITFMVRSCLRFKNERKTVKFYKYSIFKIVVINSGVGLYFSCVFYIWDVWDMAEKNTQSWRAKFRFSPIAPGYTSTGLRINQNLVEDLFLCILYNLEIKRTLFGKDRKKFQYDVFYQSQKAIIDLSSPIKGVPIIRLDWKFTSILRLKRAFKIAIKLENRRGSLFNLPDF